VVEWKLLDKRWKKIPFPKKKRTHRSLEKEARATKVEGG